MKRLYLQVKNKDKLEWVYCRIEELNDLSLENFILLINQYLINSHPTEIFFENPNILYYKSETDPTIFECYHPDSYVKCFTTQRIPDNEVVREINFSDFYIMKDYLIKVFFMKDDVA